MTRAETLEVMANALRGTCPALPAARQAAIVLASIEKAGLAVVPREATDAMVSAATRRPQPDPEPLMYPAIYRAMIAASPVRAPDA